MRNYKRALMIALFLLLFPVSVQAEEVLYDEYQSETGITIKSYAENWTGSKLVEVYEELIKNAHDEELGYLETINLYSDNPGGGEEEGMYNASYSRVKILSNQKIILGKNNSIDLYNLKDKDRIEEIAKTLSHEYGHHFTLYYLVEYENKTFEEWRDTELYKVRGLKNYDKATNDYSNGHEWNISEIVAEDYVQLYGSQTGKQVYDFEDIVSRYHSGTINKSTSYSYSTFNINPQENLSLPLALEIPELVNYWEDASHIEVKQKMISRPNLALVGAESLGYDKTQYTLQWSKSYDESGEEVDYYTLVAVDEENKEIIPIKTVEQGEPLEAVVGSIRVSEAGTTMFYTDRFIEKPKKFRVYSISSTGGIVSSQPLVVNFKNPEVTGLNTESSSMLPNEGDVSYEAEEDTLRGKVKMLFNEFTDKVILFIEKMINT